MRATISAAAAKERSTRLATDAPVGGTKLPVIDLNDIPAIADFIVRHCGLTTR